MYEVSQRFNEIINQNSRNYYWSIKLISMFGKPFDLTSSDIVQGSGYIHRANSGTQEIGIGSVYASECAVSIYSKNKLLPPLHKGRMQFFFHLVLDENEEEIIPMGEFDIVEVNRRKNIIEIKGFDAMIRFEKRLSAKETFGTPFELIKWICEKCEVDFGQTQEEIELMPNGQRLIGIYSEYDIESFRDLLHYIAKLLGGFATINRHGQLTIQHFGEESVASIDENKRFESTISDFYVRYTAVSSTNLRTNFAEYYSKDIDNGLTLNLGINPLMQFGLKEMRKEACHQILDKLSQYEYAPLDITVIGNPAYDIGDAFEVYLGTQWRKSFMTEIYYPIHGKMRIRCVGKNPLYANVKSKNDKNISGLLSQIDAEKNAVYSFSNVTPFKVNQTKHKIIDIEFATVKETDALFNASILIDKATEGESLIEFNYFINGILVDRHKPRQEIKGSDQIISLFFPLTQLEENKLHRFTVEIFVLDGIDSNIPVDGIMASISGQGLSALQTWDGKIDVSDTIEKIFVQKNVIPHLDTNLQVNNINKIPKVLNSTKSKIRLLENDNLRR